MLSGVPCKYKAFCLQNTPAWSCIQKAVVCTTRGRHFGKTWAEADQEPLQEAESNAEHHWNVVPRVDSDSIHSRALWRLKEGQMKHEQENWDSAQEDSGLTEDEFRHAFQVSTARHCWPCTDRGFQGALQSQLIRLCSSYVHCAADAKLLLLQH